MVTSAFVLRLLGKYSTGIRLAVEHGAGSASLYEYAYRNIPEGKGQLGRWIDRAFLDLGAWRAFRRQVGVTQEMVRQMVVNRRAGGLSTVVLDVSSGPAPYLRELVRQMGDAAPTVYCYDRNPHNVAMGRRLAQSESLTTIHFAVADPLDVASYLIPVHPNVILATGLFARLDDECVRAVTALAFQSVAPGGYFLATMLAEPYPQPGYLGTLTFGARPVVRSTTLVMKWFAEAGFVEVTDAVGESTSVAVVGRKPDVAC